MANGKFTLGKQSGGTLGLVFPDGVSNTEVVLPESGNLVSVDTAVTDNAIARYDGTTGKLQDSGVVIDDDGNIITYGAQINVYNAVSNTDNFEIVQRVSGKGIGFYTNGGLVKALDMDSFGNVLLKSGTGALGYGAGAGGTVTQLTSKNTAVTLNKPTGTITMNNSAIPAGSHVVFNFTCSLLTAFDSIKFQLVSGYSTYEAYTIDSSTSNGSTVRVVIRNITAVSLSESLILNYTIIKGSNS